MDHSTIKFVSSRGTVEETAGKRMICMAMEDRVREFEKRMLCESGCIYTLPMYFTSENEVETVCYDFTGFLSLEVYLRQIKFNGEEIREGEKPLNIVLKLLSEVLVCLKGMERHLLFPERYSIHPDVIFVNPENCKVSVAFYPNDQPELSLQMRFLILMEHLTGICGDDDVTNYLNRLNDMIRSNNPSMDGMLRILGSMQRDVRYIYSNAVTLRNEDQNSPPREFESENQAGSYWKNSNVWKTAMVQAAFAAGLAAVYLTGKLDVMRFAGLAILAAGGDLWMMQMLIKKWKIVPPK